MDDREGNSNVAYIVQNEDENEILVLDHESYSMRADFLFYFMGKEWMIEDGVLTWPIQNKMKIGRKYLYCIISCLCAIDYFILLYPMGRDY